MFEFIDKTVQQKDHEMSNVLDNFLNQSISSKEKAHYLSNEEVLFPVEKFLDTAYNYTPNGKSLFIQSLHSSFDKHQPFLISPDSIWYIISYEIATHIRLNKEKYRELFTTSAEKDEMDVRADWLVYGAENNDWGAAIDLFRQPIAEKIPKITQEMLLIDFSTSTDNTKLAMLSIFMDMLQHYYTFTVHTKCGIPNIRVTGTPEDWNKTILHVKVFSGIFPELEKYIARVLNVLNEIKCVEDVEGFNETFWRSIYKYNNMSGGPLITGWINDLFAYDYSDKTPVLKDWDRECNYARLDQMPTHISKVPFIWSYLGRNIDMCLVSGFLGNEFVDSYMTPKLGFGIVEIIK